MIYSIWDVEFNNLVGAYETEAAALESVRELVELNGSDYGESLALGGQEEDGPLLMLAEGGALLRRAGITAPAPRPVRRYATG
jgi:hypothetical protein